LLSGSREFAADVLINNIETLRAHDCLDARALIAQWEEAVVTQSLLASIVGSSVGENPRDNALHPGLINVAALPVLLRAVIVLKLLLRYSFPHVATLLLISNDEAAELFGEASLRLAERHDRLQPASEQ
jgi:hypothetical protein